MSTKPPEDHGKIKSVSGNRTVTVEGVSNGYVLTLEGTTTIQGGGDKSEKAISDTLVEAIEIAKAYLDTGEIPDKDSPGHPDQGLPKPPGAPDQTLPGAQPHPDQGLPKPPGSPPRPAQGLPPTAQPKK